MAQKTEPHILVADNNGELGYLSLTEIAALCERNPGFQYALEHRFEDEDEWDYGY